ncbi:hypothetical protein H6H01_23040 [Nostoc calcicola FACHB-3891]|nr:hypothetical protein [Nostoc calcicola FACHB-3891]MDZ8063576.1 hypothetical protein [Nostoc sp. EkiNYC01]
MSKYIPESLKTKISASDKGLTTIGRATIVCLRMNNPVIVVARRRWTISGWHIYCLD